MTTDKHITINSMIAWALLSLETIGKKCHVHDMHPKHAKRSVEPATSVKASQVILIQANFSHLL